MKKQLRTAKRLYKIVILITLLMFPALYATEEILPKPDEIIAKNMEAIGGIKALKKVKNKKSVSINKIVPMNIVIKDTIYQERPNKFYSLTDKGNMGKTMEGTNGKIAWGMNTSIGAGLLEGEQLSNYLFVTQFDGLDGPNVQYKSMKTVGIEKINGKDCYKVQKIREEGNERNVYYDKKSFLIVKTTSYYGSPEGKSTVETYTEEYKKINSILFPYQVVTFLNGQKYEEKKIEKIELNIKMPEGIFNIPEEVKAIMKKK